MATETEQRSESSEGRISLRLVAAILAAGLLNLFVIALCESHHPSEIVPTVLMYVEGIICLFVIAATIELGRERTARRLLVAGAGSTASALTSVALGEGFKLGGDTAAAFGWLYFVWACTLCGLSLLVVGVVRLVGKRRKLGNKGNAR
jgi:hypothetical protein